MDQQLPCYPHLPHPLPPCCCHLCHGRLRHCHLAEAGHAGYRVADGVREHAAHGAGVYSFFRDAECAVATAFVAPADAPAVRFVLPFTAWLKGRDGIRSVINRRGDGVDATHKVGRLSAHDPAHDAAVRFAVAGGSGVTALD
jgi:hypothetical protein